MDQAQINRELREQLRLRPYATLLGVAALGWFLGRSLPVGAVTALLGLGARTAMASAAERMVRDRLGPRDAARQQEHQP
jgi:hypothetical protein